MSLHQVWLFGPVFLLPNSEGEKKMLRDGKAEEDEG